MEHLDCTCVQEVQLAVRENSYHCGIYSISLVQVHVSKDVIFFENIQMVGPLSRILSEEDWNCERALIYDLAKDKTLVVWGVQQCTLWGHPTCLSNKEGIWGWGIG